MIAAVEQDLEGGTKVTTLKVDGGMIANKLFNEIQADIMGRDIVTPKITEISGWGAAVAGGIGAQQISLDEFLQQSSEVGTIKQAQATKYKFPIFQDNRYTPQKDDNWRSAELARWKEAVKRSCGWAQ